MASRLVLKVHDRAGTYIAACTNPVDALLISMRHGIGAKIRHAHLGQIWKEDTATVCMSGVDRATLLVNATEKKREERRRKLDEIYGVKP